jgi:RHS repeat-associated protein
MIRRYAIAVALSIIAAVAMFHGVSVRAGPRPQADDRPLALSGTGQSRTPLPDGRWLLLGGQGPTGPVRTTSLFDPSTGMTIDLPAQLIEARAWHTATTLSDGSILLVGGRGLGGQTLASVERFDPATDTVTSVSMANVTARAGHTATLLTDGRVLIAGGMNDAGQSADGAELWDINAQQVVPIAGGRPLVSHTATLLPDGRVLLSSQSVPGQPTTEAPDVFDPLSGRITPLAQPLADDRGVPLVTEVRPTPGATDVPLDVRLVLRFSHPLLVMSLTDQTVVLTGPDGPVTARVVPAEDGRLVFVHPADPLRPESTYVLTVTGASDAAAVILAMPSVSFGTLKAVVPVVTDDEPWVPDALSATQGWRTNRPPSPWETLAPLMAPAGATAISGRVLTLDGRPLPRVTLEAEGDASIESDRSGRFLLVLKTANTSRRVLRIRGKTANRPGHQYGFFEYGLSLTAGHTTVLPFTIWMPRLDTAREVVIPSPTTTETIITTPGIPGLELHLPAGTVLQGEDGKTVTRLGITPIPVDRPPFPLAKNVTVPVYFTIQPGGAYVQTSGAGPKGAWLVYPNYRHARVGQRIQFFHYDPDLLGWYVYGLGTVAPSGAQVMPDATTRIYAFTGAMINDGNNPPQDAPPPGDCSCTGGDPVNLTTGLFTLEQTDLSLPDVLPITVTRTYRTRDLESRPFGVGTTHPYAMFLYSAKQYEQADLILPDGGRIHYVRTSAGTGYVDAVFVHQETPTTSATPTAFYKSVMTWNGQGWDVRLKDGSVYVFGEVAPLQAIRDRSGNTITIVHANGQSGNVTRVTSPFGRWIAFTYDASNRITQAKDNIGRTVTYAYDTGGNLATVTDPEQHVTSYTYDSSHQMLTVKPPNLQGTSTNLVTNVYTTAADAPTPVGWVKTQTHADGGVYQFAYTVINGKSTQTDAIDPRGYVRRVTFNSDGYSLAETDALGQPEQNVTTSTRQIGSQFVSSSTDALSRQTVRTYDAKGNVLSVTRLAGTPDAVTTTQTYEPWSSQIATITDPLSHTTTFGYDAQGNQTSITDALNHTTSLAYNSANQLTSLTDALQHTTTSEYAGPDLVKVTDPLGRITRHFVDGAGRLVSQSDPAGQTTRFAYDTLNHLVQITDPLGGVTTNAYDPAGRLATVTDAKNHTNTYGYDVFNRLASRTDPLSRTETFTYDVNANATQRTDRKGQVTARAYDALNRLHQVTYADNSTITYTYDLGDRVTTISDAPSNHTILRTYDTLDRLLSETTSDGTVTYTYDQADRRATMTVTGQPTVSYTYDAAGRLTGMTQGTLVVAMTYDEVNQRSTLTLPNGIEVDYVYDAVSQLTGMTYRQGPVMLGALTYAYDAAGRRTQTGGSWARTALPQPFTSAAYDGANRLTQSASSPLSYDANGNLTANGLTTYTFSARDTLVGIDGAVSASFAYDGVGRRSRKTTGGITTSFLYDGANALQEIVGGVPVANRVVSLNVDEVFVRTDGSGSFSTLSDAQNSLIAESDASGSIVREAAYEPFGRTTISGGPSQNAFLYTGREWDADSGLYYYRARYYDPMVGRFTSEDPVGFGGGSDFYAYALNSPVNLIDPFGLDPAPPGDIDALRNIFPGSIWEPDINTLVIHLPCRRVRPILTAQGYQDGNSWGYNGPGSAFWNPWDHPGGSEYRTFGPGFHFRMLYERTSSFAPCPNESCTLDQFHVDPHNPLEPGQFWPHVKCDFLHWCGP